MAFARLYTSKFSRGKKPPDSPTTLPAMLLVGQTKVRPPPQNYLARTPMLVEVAAVGLHAVLASEFWFAENEKYNQQCHCNGLARVRL